MKITYEIANLFTVDYGNINMVTIRNNFKLRESTMKRGERDPRNGRKTPGRVLVRGSAIANISPAEPTECPLAPVGESVGVSRGTTECISPSYSE